VKRIVLVGAGHAHLAALRSFIEEPLYGARVALVTPQARQLYSGMLPGLIAGHYSREEVEVDVAQLCRRSFAEQVEGAVVALDPSQRAVRLADGRSLEYDLLSINAGSLCDGSLSGAARALPIKPFERFIAGLQAAVVDRVAVIGAGAAGAELSMALAYRGAAVTLYAGRPTLTPAVSERLARALRRNAVDFRPGMPASAIEEGPLIVAGASRQEFSLVLLATGPVALPWLRESGLATDEHGFVLVQDTLQSVSHPEVFAVGDCATLRDAPHPRSGVYAVRHGEALAGNLRRLLKPEPPLPYQPQRRALLLISCGARYAIAERGGFTGEGRWAWRLKDRIDRRWMASFEKARRKRGAAEGAAG
jgi:pyridine nucleotide-disulfide oxidoreductase family protein